MAQADTKQHFDHNAVKALLSDLRAIDERLYDWAKDLANKGYGSFAIKERLRYLIGLSGRI